MIATLQIWLTAVLFALLILQARGLYRMCLRHWELLDSIGRKAEAKGWERVVDICDLLRTAWKFALVVYMAIVIIWVYRSYF